MRGCRDWDRARSAQPRPQVVHHGDHAGRLDDSTEATDEISEIRKRAVQAPLAERAVLGTIRTVDSCVRTGTDIARRRFAPPRRDGTILSTGAARMIVLAGRCGLKERELELAKRIARLLSLRCETRNSPVWRVHDK